MKDIIDKIIKLLPLYFNNLISLFTKPKSFIRSLETDNEDSLENASIFFLITLVAIIISEISHAPSDKNIFIFFLSFSVVQIIIAFLTVATLKFSWLLVGGKASYKSMLIYMLYMIAPAFYIFLVFFLIGESLFKSIDPVVYQMFETSNVQGTVLTTKENEILSLSKGFHFFLIFMFIGLLSTLIYWIIFWGEYRNLNKTSIVKSVIAFFIFFILSIPMGAVGYLLGMTAR